MLDYHVDSPMAWRGDTLDESDWRIAIPQACLDEIDEALETLRLEKLPMLLLDPGEYPLQACAALMSDARRRVDDERGFLVFDRLPLERYTGAETRNVFWLLGSLLGRPVSQSIQGEIMVDVTDTGIEKTIGVRGFRTNNPQHAHTDNSFNHCPPDYVSMLSLTKAEQGGASKLISFYTVHNEMRRRYPELLPRLYRPFYQDRQGDYLPGEPQTVSYPVFTYDGELRTRYAYFTIPAGYKTADEPFEGDTRAAFEAVSEIVDDPDLYCSYVIEPGQLQMVNNRCIGHGRNAYTDSQNPAQRRHLLRLWHRDAGRRGYGG